MGLGRNTRGYSMAGEAGHRRIPTQHASLLHDPIRSGRPLGLRMESHTSLNLDIACGVSRTVTRKLKIFDWRFELDTSFVQFRRMNTLAKGDTFRMVVRANLASPESS